MLLTDRPIYKRVYAFVQDYNLVQTTANHKITKNRYAMLRAVTELSITEARRVVVVPSWADSDQLPTVYTNRQELARLVGCGPRTVYNCLTVLERAGLVQKRLHGRQNDFELVLHPWIVFGENYQAPQVAPLSQKTEKTKAPSPVFDSQERQNLPPISSCETKERFIISSNSGVDFVEKWAKSRFLALGTQNPRILDDGKRNIGKDSGTRPEKADILAENPEIKSVAEIIGKMGRASHHEILEGKDDGRAGTPPELRNPGPAQPRHHSPGQPVDIDGESLELKKALTRQFWQQAKEELWPNDYISADYERRLLNLVWCEVFGSWSGQTSPNEVTTLYLTRLQQLELAQAYAQKHGWTGFLPPPLYFSRKQFLEEKKSNKRGSFWWTYEWVKATNSKRRQKIKADQLARAVQSMISGQAPRGLKDSRDYDRIRLYHYWRNRLGKYGDSRLLDEFDSKISTLILT
jgi:hypothetical protein